MAVSFLPMYPQINCHPYTEQNVTNENPSTTVMSNAVTDL